MTHSFSHTGDAVHCSLVLLVLPLASRDADCQAGTWVRRLCSHGWRDEFSKLQEKSKREHGTLMSLHQAPCWQDAGACSCPYRHPSTSGTEHFQSGKSSSLSFSPLPLHIFVTLQKFQTTSSLTYCRQGLGATWGAVRGTILDQHTSPMANEWGAGLHSPTRHPKRGAGMSLPWHCILKDVSGETASWLWQALPAAW